MTIAPTGLITSWQTREQSSAARSSGARETVVKRLILWFNADGGQTGHAAMRKSSIRCVSNSPVASAATERSPPRSCERRALMAPPRRSPGGSQTGATTMRPGTPLEPASAAPEAVRPRARHARRDRPLSRRGRARRRAGGDGGIRARLRRSRRRRTAARSRLADQRAEAIVCDYLARAGPPAADRRRGIDRGGRADRRRRDVSCLSIRSTGRGNSSPATASSRSMWR